MPEQKPDTVVYCPCPGAPEVQEIQKFFRELMENRRTEVLAKYAKKDRYGRVHALSLGSIEDLEDNEEAREDLESYWLSKTAVDACLETLDPINAPFVEAQEKEAISRGAIPDYCEAMSGLMEVGVRNLIFDSVNVADNEG